MGYRRGYHRRHVLPCRNSQPQAEQAALLKLPSYHFLFFKLQIRRLSPLASSILSDEHYRQMTKGLHVVPVCGKSEGRYKLFKHCLGRYRGTSSSSRNAEGHWAQNAAWTEDMESHRRAQALCGAVIARKWNAMAPWQCALWNNT